MSVKLKSIIRVNNDAIKQVAIGTISSGAGGDILTVSPPEGRRIVLTNLSTGTGLSESSISVFFGVNEVITNKTIDGALPTTNAKFSVGNYQDYAGTVPPMGNFYELSGGINETLIVNKISGTTSNTIYYGYEVQ